VTAHTVLSNKEVRHVPGKWFRSDWRRHRIHAVLVEGCHSSARRLAGISLAELLGQANRAYPKIKSIVIILDSCQSGFLGEVAGLGTDELSILGSGVTILTPHTGIRALSNRMVTAFLPDFS